MAQVAKGKSLVISYWLSEDRTKLYGLRVTSCGLKTKDKALKVKGERLKVESVEWVVVKSSGSIL